MLSLLGIVVGLVLNCEAMTDECGTVNIPRGLKIEANQTRKGVWPFATALYEVKGSRLLCGGSLISTKHVLTGIKSERNITLYVAIMKFFTIFLYCILFSFTLQLHTVFIIRSHH